MHHASITHANGGNWPKNNHYACTIRTLLQLVQSNPRGIQARDVKLLCWQLLKAIVYLHDLQVGRGRSRGKGQGIVLNCAGMRGKAGAGQHGGMCLWAYAWERHVHGYGHGMVMGRWP